MWRQDGACNLHSRWCHGGYAVGDSKQDYTETGNGKKREEKSSKIETREKQAIPHKPQATHLSPSGKATPNTVWLASSHMEIAENRPLGEK